MDERKHRQVSLRATRRRRGSTLFSQTMLKYGERNADPVLLQSDPHGVTPTNDLSSAARSAQSRLEFLAEASRLLNDSLDAEKTLTTLAQLLVPYLADWCTIHLVDPERQNRLTAMALADKTKQDLIDALYRYQLQPDAPAGFPRTIRTGQSEFIPHVSDALLNSLAYNNEHLSILRSLELQSCMIVPLISRGRTLGSISLATIGSERSYTSGDLTFAEDLARRAASAIDNAQLYQATRRRVTELSMVQDMARAINSSLRLDDIFHIVVEQLRKAFGYELVSIYLCETDKLILKAQVGYDDEHMLPVIPFSQGVAGRVVRNGQPAFLHDVGSDPEYIMTATGVRQALIIPLKNGAGQVLGILAVEARDTPHLSEDDFVLLSLLADQVSVAITNARLFGALQASEQRYRTLVTQAADGIVLLDSAGEVIDANDQAAAILGYKRTYVQGRRLLRFVVRSEAAKARALRAALLQNGRAFGTVRLRRADTSQVPVEISIGKIDDELILAILRDVSERQQLEAQLRQAQKLEAVGTLANGLAHDFSNLLAAIKGAAALVMQATPAQDARRFDLEQIMSAVQRGTGLTRQLLAFSRPTPTEHYPIQVDELIQEALQLLRSALPASIHLKLDFEASLWKIQADPIQIQQVLFNLVVNARDAMPDGGTITIALANMLLDAAFCQRHLGMSEGAYLRLSVADMGKGMGEETLRRAFEPFFTTKPLGEGTGLGLAMCHGIVSSHNGYINIVSTSGQGTQVIIYLPALAV